MVRLLALLLVLSISPYFTAADEAPRVVLVGIGEHEAAPHGKGNVYAPCVLIDYGKWKMWYGGQGKDGHDRISYAESADGKHWTKIGVVLEDKKANHINDPSVIKVRGKFFMYFTRAEKFVIDRIHVATSSDGVTWKQHGVALGAGPDGAWDSLSVGRPSVIYEQGLFKLWYDGRKVFPPGTPVESIPISTNSHRYVGHATSKDGLHWRRHSDKPVFSNGAGGVDVKRLKDSYFMVYESQGGTRYAQSNNGIQWQDAGWLLQKSMGDVDRYGHVTPFLLIDDRQEAWLYFGAASASSWDQNCIAVQSVTLPGPK